MGTAAVERTSFRLSVSSVARLLIAGYFLGLGFGLLEGATVGILFSSYLSVPLANFAGAALVVALAALVIAGFLRKPATVLLALLVFAGSYLTLFVAAGSDAIGAFWRDCALAGALLLTLREAPEGASVDLRSAIPRVKALLSISSVRRRSKGRSQSDAPAGAPDAGASRHPGRVRTEVYRHDFDAVRVN